ncbi:hypothetical protein [Ligilactobacillus acidipiscis]|uniref:hypothetical protein n=1 Tax=Ligilactobacillus acidipiscis TaxID=89059 RepID=UPI001E3B58FC|nr:hypothetical protein [Ligilactobacillus acidipiscis]
MKQQNNKTVNVSVKMLVEISNLVEINNTLVLIFLAEIAGFCQYNKVLTVFRWVIFKIDLGL